METTEVEVFDSLAARDELLASLGEEKGARYWSTLRAFIIAKLSKRELDAFLRETLDAGQLSLHNRLIRAVVGNAARTLPSVRERAKVLGARTSSGLWGSDRPAVPNVHHQLAPSFDFALTMPRTYPNRLKPGAPVRTPLHSKGRVRSCAFSSPPSDAQILALRRRVLTVLPTESGAPKEISEESLQMLSLAVQCHVRALLSALILSRQAAEQGSGRLAGVFASGRGLARHSGQRRRITLGDLHSTLSLSARVSTAVAWQLPLCRTAPPSRWVTANLEAISSVAGPHMAMIPGDGATPWSLSGHGFESGAESLRSQYPYEFDDDSCDNDWETP